MLIKVTAVASIAVGLVCVCFQVASYFETRQVVDYVSAGIWGGLLMITTAVMCLLHKSEVKIVLFSGLSVLSGLVMVIIYSWNLNRFYRVYTTVHICEFYAPGLLIDPRDCSDFVSFHALFIALGLAAVLIDGVILVITMRSIVKESMYIRRQSEPSKLYIHKRQTLI